MAYQHEMGMVKSNRKSVSTAYTEMQRIVEKLLAGL